MNPARAAALAAILAGGIGAACSADSRGGAPAESLQSQTQASAAIVATTSSTSSSQGPEEPPTSHPGGSASDTSTTTTSSAASDVSLPTAMVTALPVGVQASGDAATICDTLVSSVQNHYPFDGSVIADSTPGTSRWLFCAGDGASGIGVVVGVLDDEATAWRVTDLGFGFDFHAGNAVDAVAFDDQRAAVTSDSLSRVLHVHGWTDDSGRSWTVVSKQDG